VIYSRVARSDLLRVQQASAELEMFYQLSVEGGVMLLSQCRYDGTQISSAHIGLLEKKVHRRIGQS
jgi:hypothetical protein